MAALPALARSFSSNPRAYEYLAESILAWPDQAALSDLIRATGRFEVETGERGAMRIRDRA